MTQPLLPRLPDPFDETEKVKKELKEARSELAMVQVALSHFLKDGPAFIDFDVFAHAAEHGPGGKVDLTPVANGQIKLKWVPESDA